MTSKIMWVFLVKPNLKLLFFTKFLSFLNPHLRKEMLIINSNKLKRSVLKDTVSSFKCNKQDTISRLQNTLFSANQANFPNFIYSIQGHIFLNGQLYSCNMAMFWPTKTHFWFQIISSFLKSVKKHCYCLLYVFSTALYPQCSIKWFWELVWS